jgi:hypothetical protein
MMNQGLLEAFKNAEENSQQADKNDNDGHMLSDEELSEKYGPFIDHKELGFTNEQWESLSLSLDRSMLRLRIRLNRLVIASFMHSEDASDEEIAKELRVPVGRIQGYFRSAKKGRYAEYVDATVQYRRKLLGLENTY